MIVVDIETSGLNPVKCGIWQIGAIDLDSGESFFQESRIDDEDVVEQGALNVIGKTEQELRNSDKQSQKELLEQFFNWSVGKSKVCICQHPQFDAKLPRVGHDSVHVRPAPSLPDRPGLAPLGKHDLGRTPKDDRGFRCGAGRSRALDSRRNAGAIRYSVEMAAKPVRADHPAYLRS